MICDYCEERYATHYRPLPELPEFNVHVCDDCRINSIAMMHKDWKIIPTYTYNYSQLAQPKANDETQSKTTHLLSGENKG